MNEIQEMFLFSAIVDAVAGFLCMYFNLDPLCWLFFGCSVANGCSIISASEFEVVR